MRVTYLINNTSVDAERDIFSTLSITNDEDEAIDKFQELVVSLLKAGGKRLKGDENYIINTIEKKEGVGIIKIIESDSGTYVKNEYFEFYISSLKEEICCNVWLKTLDRSYEIKILPIYEKENKYTFVIE